MEVLSNLLWVALLVYLVERVRPLALRLLGTQEKRLVQPMGSSRLPADLQIQAQSYKDQWARADAEKRFQELYEELGGDWDRVRAFTGGTVDSTSGH